MLDFDLYAEKNGAISEQDAVKSLFEAIDGLEKAPKRVLLVVPDYTRLHSCAGFIANALYHRFSDTAEVTLLAALGTHAPMTRKECAAMYGDIPYERFVMHDWRNGVTTLGEIPAEFVSEVSGGVFNSAIEVQVNRLLLSDFDLILSIGQVVPHEVVGMANHSKNIFVGCGGSSMINSSHALGAFYGMERMMGRDGTPVRRVFDYAAEHYLSELPLCYILTVVTAPGGSVKLHGLFAGSGRSHFERAVELAQNNNLTLMDRPLKKVVVFLDGDEFKSTWLGNKAVYRTRMAIEDGGELIVLAPGVERFGEDSEIDALIRKYGYIGRENIARLCAEQEDLRENMSAAAHLIHGSSDGRFKITYCTRLLTQKEVESVGFSYMDYAEAEKLYAPGGLKDGFNTVNGEEIFYISNPALGLWADRRCFKEEG